jgi:hypothetical protein
VGGDSFHQELGLEHVELEASVILENMFEVSEDAKSNATFEVRRGVWQR